jgi:hypothetical protein
MTDVPAQNYRQYEVQGDYGQGFECACTESTFKEAKEQAKLYRENEPQYSHRIIKKRVRVSE